MEKCCDICGDIGVSEAIISCSRCGNCEHMYCMRTLHLEAPNDDWLCEECESSSKKMSVGSSSASDLPNVSKLAVCVEDGKGAALHAYNGDRRMPRATEGNCPEKSLKRPREESDPNRLEGADSFWDEEDPGLAWRRRRSLIDKFDMKQLDERSEETLAEAAAAGCAQIMHVTAIMEKHIREYKERGNHAEGDLKKYKARANHAEGDLKKYKARANHAEGDLKKYKARANHAEADFKRMAEENTALKEECEKLHSEKAKLKTELDFETMSGASFLGTEVCRQYLEIREHRATRSAIKDFMDSLSFKEILEKRAMSAVKECQEILRKTGQVSEDIIQMMKLSELETDGACNGEGNGNALGGLKAKMMDGGHHASDDGAGKADDEN